MSPTPPARARGTRPARGATLVEALVAIVLLAVGAGGLLSVAWRLEALAARQAAARSAWGAALARHGERLGQPCVALRAGTQHGGGWTARWTVDGGAQARRVVEQLTLRGAHAPRHATAVLPCRA